jgi:hypothetical protein
MCNMIDFGMRKPLADTADLMRRDRRKDRCSNAVPRGLNRRLDLPLLWMLMTMDLPGKTPTLSVT